MLRSKYLISLLLISSLFGAKYLAVLDLDPEGLSASEAKILTQRLTSKMIELSDYTIVERANLDKILEEMKLQKSGLWSDSKCAVEIGQMAGADLTVVGTASKFGETYTIDARIIDVESGSALASASFTHTGKIDELVKDGIESIAHELLGIPYQKRIKSKSSSGYGGTFDIQSNPAGAEIYIGGNYFDITPIILEDFPAGNYEVSIKLINYHVYREEVNLPPRGNVKINAQLTCGGLAVMDNCGVCDNNPENDCLIDCAGVQNGNAILDECGVCEGNNSTCVSLFKKYDLFYATLPILFFAFSFTLVQ